MPLKKLLEQAVSSEAYSVDPAQQIAITAFQDCYEALTQPSPVAPWLQRLFKKPLPMLKTSQQGLYLWGDVGRGKSWLMHLFYNSLPFAEKRRIHFHPFMLDVHHRLSAIQNRKNPLICIARDYAQLYRVICLDEFIVTNITDALLLHGLLQALHEHGVMLIMTSNRRPDDLYLNGLQRERFLPAIELIKQTNRIIHLDGEIDHRTVLSPGNDATIMLDSEASRSKLQQAMQRLAGESLKQPHTLSIHNRPIASLACGDGVAWFDFEALCNAPRATQDYLQLAEQFHTLLLSKIPVMDEYMDDKARRFIYLIDALYDRKVKILLSAETEPEQLYRGAMLKFAFKRTLSRLIEMQ
ncbi:MAG: cell division protein ZapE, partial [Gammaproteobacteria bacterium]|nr:cell division protein ZapE [Gammaproteobacteria bacterium]